MIVPNVQMSKWGLSAQNLDERKNYLRINKIRTKHILDAVTVSKFIGRLGDTLLILDFQHLQMTFVYNLQTYNLITCILGLKPSLYEC